MSRWEMSRKKAKKLVVIYYISDNYSNAINQAVLKIIAPEFPKVGFALVHCTAKDNWTLCKEHAVEEYPAIKFFKDQKTQKGRSYNGDHDPEQIMEFVRKNAQKKKMKLEL